MAFSKANLLGQPNAKFEKLSAPGPESLSAPLLMNWWWFERKSSKYRIYGLSCSGSLLLQIMNPKVLFNGFKYLLDISFYSASHSFKKNLFINVYWAPTMCQMRWWERWGQEGDKGRFCAELFWPWCGLYSKGIPILLPLPPQHLYFLFPITIKASFWVIALIFLLRMTSIRINAGNSLMAYSINMNFVAIINNQI